MKLTEATLRELISQVAKEDIGKLEEASAIDVLGKDVFNMLYRLKDPAARRALKIAMNKGQGLLQKGIEPDPQKGVFGGDASKVASTFLAQARSEIERAESGKESPSHAGQGDQLGVGTVRQEMELDVDPEGGEVPAGLEEPKVGPLSPEPKPKPKKKKRRGRGGRGIRFTGRKAKSSIGSVLGVQAAIQAAGVPHTQGDDFLDGKNGPGTLKALKYFQKAAGLKPDGIVGPATVRALHQVSRDLAAGVEEREAARQKAKADNPLELSPKALANMEKHGRKKRKADFKKARQMARPWEQAAARPPLDSAETSPDGLRMRESLLRDTLKNILAEQKKRRQR